MAIPQISVGGVVANLILVVLSISAVALRFYARKRSKQPLKSDDWVISVCLVCSFSKSDLCSKFHLINYSNRYFALASQSHPYMRPAQDFLESLLGL